MKVDLRTLTTRVDHAEETLDAVVREMRTNTCTLRAHDDRFQDLQSQIEDLDNRGRRLNLRVRGLPESILLDPIGSD